MALDFPASPSVNDTYTSGGRTWRWNGTAWVGATPYSGQATITGGTINNTPIGGTTRAAGAFTTVDANSNILSSGGVVGYSSGTTVYTIGSGGYNGPVGGSTPAAGAFTTLKASSGLNVTGAPVNGTTGVNLEAGDIGGGVFMQRIYNRTSAAYGILELHSNTFAWKVDGGTSVLSASGTGLAVTGGVSSSYWTSTTTNPGLTGKRIAIDFDATSTGRIFVLGADTTTNGNLIITSLRSDGSNAVTVGTFSSTGLAVTGNVVINAGNDLQLYNTSGNAYWQIYNSAGSGAANATFRYSGVNYMTVSNTGLAVTGQVTGTGMFRTTGTTSNPDGTIDLVQMHVSPQGDPQIFMVNASASADSRTWSTYVNSSGSLVGIAQLDNLSSAGTWLTVTRTGTTINSIDFGAKVTVTGGITASATISAISTNPRIEWYDNGGGTNAKRWDFLASAGVGSFRLVNDANSSAYTWLQVSRTDITSAQIAAPPVYAQTTGSAANVFVDSNGDLKRSTSSIKYKTDVRDYTRGLDAIMSLRPVFYKGKDKRDGDKQFAGLIAEEVHDAGLTEFVQYDKDGNPDALAYQNMVALLISSSKELVAELKTLRARVAQLENK